MRLEVDRGRTLKGLVGHAKEFEIYSKSREENCDLFHHESSADPYHTEKKRPSMIQFSTFHLKQKDKYVGKRRKQRGLEIRKTRRK